MKSLEDLIKKNYFSPKGSVFIEEIEETVAIYQLPINDALELQQEMKGLESSADEDQAMAAIRWAARITSPTAVSDDKVQQFARSLPQKAIIEIFNKGMELLNSTNEEIEKN